jgi:hypothetical protein
MSRYKYINPINNGYVKFNITRKIHNEIFPRRKMGILNSTEYYYNEATNKIQIHFFYNLFAQIGGIMLFPILVILSGVINFKSAWNDLIKLLNQKKTGNFTTDSCVLKSQPMYDSKKYEILVNAINKTKKR